MIFEKTAIILAAGRGRRLDPLTSDTPKTLLPVAGKCFLERALTSFQENNLNNITIATGYLKNRIEDFIADKFSHSNIVCVDNELFETTNTAASLFVALKKMNGPFYLLDGDLLFDNSLLDRLKNDDHENVMIVDTDTSKLDEEAMKVVFDRAGKILKLGKQIPVNEAAGEFIGLAKFSAEWCDLLKKEMIQIKEKKKLDNLYYEDVISGLLADGPPLHILPTNNGVWAEVDTAEEYRQVNQSWMVHSKNL